MRRRILYPQYAFAPRGGTPAPQGWTQQPSATERFRRRPPISLQQFDAMPPQTITAAVVTVWADSFYDSVKRSRVLEVALLDNGVPALTPAAQPQGAAGFFDTVQRTRMVEVALLEQVIWPVFQVPTATSPQGYEWRTTEVFAKKFPAGAQMDSFFTEYQVPTAFVGNAWTVTWDGPRRGRFPAGAQIFAPWPASGDLVSTPQGWPSVFPERFARPFPAKAQLDSFFTAYQVPTQFVGNAWVVSWDGPPRARFPAGSQVFAPWSAQGDLTSTPQGWPFAWPERFAKRFPVAEQLTTGDQWIGNVPTAATAQGWPAIFPERFARKVPASLQQFDLPVLSAYGTVVVTYPEGWRPLFPDRIPRAQRLPQQFDLPVLGAYVAYTFPEGWRVAFPDSARRFVPTDMDFVDTAQPAAFAPRGWSTFAEFTFRKRAKDVGIFAIGQVAAAQPQGWPSVEAAVRRAGKAQGAEFSATPANVTFLGWSVAFEPRRGARRPPQGLEAFARVPDAAPRGWNAPVEAPLRAARPILSRGVTWPLDRPVANVTVYPEGWRVEFSHTFKRQVAMPFEIFRYSRQVIIVGRPPLMADNQAPTLKGTDAPPREAAVSAPPRLKGVDDAPEEDATLSAPTLKGKV